jgi:hypothetical protein
MSDRFFAQVTEALSEDIPPELPINEVSKALSEDIPPELPINEVSKALSEDIPPELPINEVSKALKSNNLSRHDRKDLLLQLEDLCPGTVFPPRVEEEVVIVYQIQYPIQLEVAIIKKESKYRFKVTRDIYTTHWGIDDECLTETSYFRIPVSKVSATSMEEFRSFIHNLNPDNLPEYSEDNDNNDNIAEILYKKFLELQNFKRRLNERKWKTYGQNPTNVPEGYIKATKSKSSSDGVNYKESDDTYQKRIDKIESKLGCYIHNYYGWQEDYDPLYKELMCYSSEEYRRVLKRGIKPDTLNAALRRKSLQ